MQRTSHSRRFGFRRAAATVAGMALIVAACGSDDTAIQEPAIDSTDLGVSLEGELVVLNEGGAMEGHTPRGFAGSGVGLFAGDNLNSNFPNDDGVQIWLTFDLPPEAQGASSVVLASDALEVRGDPFGALGQLQAAPVAYDEFSPAIFSLEPDGEEITCPLPTDASFTCDITSSVLDDLGDGRVQLRLRFEEIGDGDGEQDLALFFLTDSNTNEPGIFELRLNP